jgi:hypothetical protein
VALLPANDLPPIKVYINVLPKPASAPAYPPAPPTPPAAPGPNESSVCLQLALSRSRGGVRLSTDEIPANALSEISAGGPKMYIDAWGLPLSFYRWPTGNSELLGLNTTKFADPLDPEGLLLNPNWYNNPNLIWPGTQSSSNPLTYRQVFELLCHPIGPMTSTTPPAQYTAYYVIPTLASAGRDTVLGLDLTTMATTNANAVLDNIYSYRLRIGASGSLK